MEGRVKLTDFGLARTADDASMTQSGVIAGTPMYMAPEQALGHKLDQRADLFSFGSVLYQMLTGRPPFRAPTTMAVLKRVTEDTPRPIQEVIPEVPMWMCELIGHLHAKNPDQRYNSAQQLSDLIGQCLIDFQEGREFRIPAPSRPADEMSPLSSANTMRRSGRNRDVRRPLLKVAVVVLALLAGLGFSEATGVTKLTSTVIRLTMGSGTLVIKTDDPEVRIEVDGEEVTIREGRIDELALRPGKYRIAATKEGKPVKQELVTITRNQRTEVYLSLQAAGTISRSGEMDDQDPAGAAPATKPAIPYLKKSLLGHAGTIFNVTYSRDGRFLASSGDKQVRVWDARSGMLRYALPVSKTYCYMALTFSPDGKYLLTASENRSQEAPISIWDMDTGAQVGSREGHQDGLLDLSFSEDGKILLACGHENHVRMWDFASRSKIRDIPLSWNGYARTAEISKKGQIAFGPHNVILANRQGEVVNTLNKSADVLCFSPDGTRLAGTTYREGLVTVWDADSGEEISSWRAHAGLANGVAFSPVGKVLVTAGSDGKVRLWDFKTQRQLAELSHEGEAYAVAFSPDGETLATCGTRDRLVKLWDVSMISVP